MQMLFIEPAVPASDQAIVSPFLTAIGANLYIPLGRDELFSVFPAHETLHCSAPPEPRRMITKIYAYPLFLHDTEPVLVPETVT